MYASNSVRTSQWQLPIRASTPAPSFRKSALEMSPFLNARDGRHGRHSLLHWLHLPQHYHLFHYCAGIRGCVLAFERILNESIRYQGPARTAWPAIIWGLLLSGMGPSNRVQFNRMIRTMDDSLEYDSLFFSMVQSRTNTRTLVPTYSERGNPSRFEWNRRTIPLASSRIGPCVAKVLHICFYD